MSSLQVSDNAAGADTGLSFSGATKRQRKWLAVGSFIAGTFIVGISCGLWISSKGQEQALGQCAETNGVSDIAAELEEGINKLIEWYPSAADKLRANKKEIVERMVNIEEPGHSSILRKAWFDKKAIKLPVDEPEMERRLLPQVGPPFLVTAKCYRSLADFLFVSTKFLAGFIKFAIPQEHAFKTALVKWLAVPGPALAIEKQIRLAADFVWSGGVKKKAKILWNVLCAQWKAGGGYIKFLFDWIVDKVLDPWAQIKNLIKLSAQLSVWYTKGATQFAGKMALQVLGAQAFVGLGKVVIKACNVTKA